MRLGSASALPPARRTGGSYVALGGLALVFILGWISGAQNWRQNWAQMTAAAERALTPAGTGAPVLTVDMDFADYHRLLQQRERALETGVVSAGDADFVPATLRLEQTTAQALMRLPGGPAQRLGADEAWSFEVRLDEDSPTLFDMRRFYLQAPEANHWLDAWAFAQTLQREGLLTARYTLVRLIFNGDDRGYYALQEGFAEELLRAQGRTPGVIVEFDAAPLWESIAHFSGNVQSALADPVANLGAADFRYLEINTFRDAAIAADPTLASQQARAIELLYALQTGAQPAAAVFDVERYGHFLALADLWGATEATSLVNLKYYFNPETQRLEPISFNPNPLAGDARISLATAYNAPQIMAAYVRAAVRLSRPEYLAEVQAALEPEWQRLRHMLGREGAQLQPPWAALQQRQDWLRRSLEPVQPVFAYLETNSAPPYDTVRIHVGNVLNLPQEIIGFDINGATFLEVDPAWVTEADRTWLEEDAGVILRAFNHEQSAVVRYVQFNLPLTRIHELDREIDFNRVLEIQVATRILGAETTQLTPARPGPFAPADTPAEPTSAAE